MTEYKIEIEPIQVVAIDRSLKSTYTFELPKKTVWQKIKNWFKSMIRKHK